MVALLPGRCISVCRLVGKCLLVAVPQCVQRHSYFALNNRCNCLALTHIQIHSQSCLSIIPIVNMKTRNSWERSLYVKHIDVWQRFPFSCKYFWYQRRRHIAGATCPSSKRTTPFPNRCIFALFVCLLSIYLNESEWGTTGSRDYAKWYFLTIIAVIR